MKEIFDLRRFGKYLASDIKDCTARYGLSLLIISLMGIIIYLVGGFGSLLLDGGWKGPDLVARVVVFLPLVAILVITMPVKCYGHITDRKSGSRWLMIPASVTEKYLSMIVISCIIMPAFFIGTYVLTDALLCAIDPSCGEPVYRVRQMMDEALAVPELEQLDFLKSLANPWMYIDDIVSNILTFLLGAILFRKNKVVFTFLGMMTIGMVLSTAMTPLMIHYLMDGMNSAELYASDPYRMMELPLFRNIELVDTIGDVTIMTGMLIAIFVRIKTLKH